MCMLIQGYKDTRIQGYKELYCHCSIKNMQRNGFSITEPI